MLKFKKDLSFRAIVRSSLGGELAGDLTYYDWSDGRVGKQLGWVVLHKSDFPDGLNEQFWFGCYEDTNSPGYRYEIRTYHPVPANWPYPTSHNKHLDLSYNRYVGLYEPSEVTGPLWTLTDERSRALELTTRDLELNAVKGIRIASPANKPLKAYNKKDVGYYINEVSGETLNFNLEIVARGVDFN